MTRIPPTANCVWTALAPVIGKDGSDRMRLYAFVQAHPRCTTSQIHEAVTLPRDNLQSRLIELERGKHLRREFVADLFEGG